MLQQQLFNDGMIDYGKHSAEESAIGIAPEATGSNVMIKTTQPLKW